MRHDLFESEADSMRILSRSKVSILFSLLTMVALTASLVTFQAKAQTAHAATASASGTALLKLAPLGTTQLGGSASTTSNGNDKQETSPRADSEGSPKLYISGTTPPISAP